MNTRTVFIGGSRQASHLSTKVKERLNNIVDKGHRVIVGDANGADKAIQKHLSAVGYDNVTVFYSGDYPRNNLGQWRTQNVRPPKSAKGYQYYAAKDREMAQQADFGLMIWDSKSAGTVLNALRLIRAGKVVVLVNLRDKSTINIKSQAQWDEFLARCSAKLLADLRKRATRDEWKPTEMDLEPTLFDTQERVGERTSSLSSEDELAASINAALAASDPTLVVDALGNIARARGMTQVAKDTGLARESLYRSLAVGGNPEFATVLKVMTALGLRLEANKTRTGDSV